MRFEYVKKFLGKPWRANGLGPDAWDCWHLVRHVEDELFGRALPRIEMPDAPSWEWMLAAVQNHPERKRWTETPMGPFNTVRAGDGAIVLMARNRSAAHAGIWFAPERRVLHADPDEGVVFDPIGTLIHAKHWLKLYFMEPMAK